MLHTFILMGFILLSIASSNSGDPTATSSSAISSSAISSSATSGSATSTTIGPTTIMTTINATSIVPTTTFEVPETTTIQCDPNIASTCVPLITVETSTTSVVGSTFFTNILTFLASTATQVENGGEPESSANSLKEKLSVQIVATILAASIALTLFVI